MRPLFLPRSVSVCPFFEIFSRSFSSHSTFKTRLFHKILEVVLPFVLRSHGGFHGFRFDWAGLLEACRYPHRHANITCFEVLGYWVIYVLSLMTFCHG